MTLIQKKNEVYLKVNAEPHVHKELSDHFQFDVPGAKYMPQYQKYKWDGKIRLYSPATGEIYAGLFDYLTDFLEERGYHYQIQDNNVQMNKLDRPNRIKFRKNIRKFVSEVRGMLKKK